MLSDEERWGQFPISGWLFINIKQNGLQSYALSFAWDKYRMSALNNEHAHERLLKFSNFPDEYHLHILSTLQWRHNERDCVSNHRRLDCILNPLVRRRSKKTSKLRVTGLCVGNSPGTGEFPAQIASNAENVSIWWRHHEHEAICWNSCSYSTQLASITIRCNALYPEKSSDRKLSSLCDTNGFCSDIHKHSHWRQIMMTSSNGNIFCVTGHLCGESNGYRWIPRTRLVTRSFDVSFDLRLNKRLSKQSWGWWFETPPRPLWRHSNVVNFTK